MRRTFFSQVLQVDVQQDAAVAAAHHQQGDDVQCGEVEHVVHGFLPSVAEAAMSRALSEIHSLHPDGSEDEQLAEDRRSTGECGAQEQWLTEALQLCAALQATVMCFSLNLV